MTRLRAVGEAFGLLGPADFVDILLVATLIYLALVWFKHTRAGFVAVGMSILAGVYLLARALDLVLTGYIFQAFFAVILVALVVIFQEELRRFFERIAVWSLRRRGEAPLHSSETEVLVRTLADLARDRVGALVVLVGRDPIERHVTGGIELDGKLSEALLKSIFDPHSMGHDGAVIVEGGRVVAFGVHLPLSREDTAGGRLGTRHAAALGLTERTDALCLVASEERGTISVAHGGVIEAVDHAVDLRGRLDQHLARETAVGAPAWWNTVWRTNQREKLASLGLSVGLWFMFAAGSKTAETGYELPVITHNVPDGLRVEAVIPVTVRVTLAGPRRRFFFFDTRNLAVHVDLSSAKLGDNEFVATRQVLPIPEELSLVRADPPTVIATLGPIPETAEQLVPEGNEGQE